MKTKDSSKLISLRIVLIPEKKLSDASVSFARQCSKLDEIYYVIDGEKYLPHITLYYGKFDASVKIKVLKVVEEISKKYEKISLKFEKVELIEGWLWLRFKLSRDLEQLHDEMLMAFKSLGEVHPYSKKENYQPHLSLLRYKSENLDPAVFGSGLKVDGYNFNLNGEYLAVANAGEHGTVSYLIKKYKLKI